MDKRSARILMVESDPLTRDKLHVRLEEAGYACANAMDGIQAMEQIGQLDFDLILLEHLLPGMNGIGCSTTFVNVRRNTNCR